MPHKLSSTHLINQGDTSIYNPGTSTPAFTDANFLRIVEKQERQGLFKNLVALFVILPCLFYIKAGSLMQRNPMCITPFGKQLKGNGQRC